MIRKVHNFLCSPPSKEVSLSIAFWSSFCVGLLINKTALSHAFKEGCQLSYQVNDPFFEESLRCSVHSDPWSCGAAEDRDPEGEVRASAAPESELSKFYTHLGTRTARSTQWLECQTCDKKVAGSSPWRSGRIIFFSRVNFLCWSTLISVSVPFPCYHSSR